MRAGGGVMVVVHFVAICKNIDRGGFTWNDLPTLTADRTI